MAKKDVQVWCRPNFNIEDLLKEGIILGPVESKAIEKADFPFFKGSGYGRCERAAVSYAKERGYNTVNLFAWLPPQRGIVKCDFEFYYCDAGKLFEYRRRKLRQALDKVDPFHGLLEGAGRGRKPG